MLLRKDPHRPARRLVAAALLLAAASAHAQPANDAWANRTPIPALPFTPPALAVDAATVEASDPPFFCKLSADANGARTVWYAFTTGSEPEYVDLSAGGYDTLVAVYTGSPTAGFEAVAGGCNDDGGVARASRIAGLALAPNTEYSIVVAAANATVPAVNLAFSVQGSRRYLVNSVADTLGGSCGASCSLREAIAAANADPGVVLVPPGTYVLTRSGSGENANATGDLDVRAPMGIYRSGKGAVVVDGGGLDRVLHVDPTDTGAHTVAITGLTLRNGNPGFGDGGALYNEASTASPVPTHDYVDFALGALRDSRTSLNGGGARLNGIAALSDCTVDGNTAASSGGGLSFAGPTAQPLRWRVQRCTVSRNASTSGFAGGGGGVHAVTLSGQLLASTVSDNGAGFNGGGVLVTQQGSLAVVDSTIAFNTAGNSGGGLRHEGVAASVANSALGGNEFGSGPVTFTQDCASASSALPFEGRSVTSETPCGFTTGSDNLVAATLLGPLADNGGPSETRRPVAGSPLVDSGTVGCAAQDQRGKARPQDGDGAGGAVCDRGAVELEQPVPDAVFADGFEPPPPR
jgi:CSLREA domain-containing protein